MNAKHIPLGLFLIFLLPSLAFGHKPKVSVGDGETGQRLTRLADSQSQRTSDASATYLNPILGGDHPDPTILRKGSDYYMTHSSFNYVPGLTVYHSRDLVHWQPVCAALSQYLGAVWAPDICQYKDRYYIYFTVSRGNDDFHNYVVTAPSPTGPWSDAVDLHVSRWIDPCHVVDEQTGQRWLFLSGGHRIRLSADGLSTVGKLEKVYDGWPIPRDWTVEGTALEGPKVKKIGSYYYLLSAEGGTAGAPTSHMTVVARARSVDGPWENSPYNPLIHTYGAGETWWSKGHASLIDTPDGRWWAVFHAYQKDYLSLGRQTLLEPVEVTADGWLRAPLDKDVAAPIRCQLPLTNEADSTSRLSQFRIGYEWKFYKHYDTSRMRTFPGGMEMQGRGTDPASSSPMLFVTGAHRYEFCACIECDSDAVAGLILYYNDRYYVGTGCDRHNRHKWRRGEYRGRTGRVKGMPIWLKLCNEDNVVTGYYSYDGKTWTKEVFGMEISGYNHNTLGDFQSVLPGLFVYGKGKARFTDFHFQERD
jgi:xylan 1,4-beta-xylosidase